MKGKEKKRAELTELSLFVSIREEIARGKMLGRILAAETEC